MSVKAGKYQSPIRYIELLGASLLIVLKAALIVDPENVNGFSTFHLSHFLWNSTISIMDVRLVIKVRLIVTQWDIVT